MIWQSSYFSWSYLCLLTLEYFNISSGHLCNPGYMATHFKTKCVPCPPEQYNPKPNDSNECLNCVPCGIYSVQVSPCTATSNTKCRCLDSFSPLDKTQKRCTCKSGSVIKSSENGIEICKKCPLQTFTDRNNSKFQPLPKYDQSSENNPRNVTSDVSCGNVAQTVVPSHSPLPLSLESTSSSTMTPSVSRKSDPAPTASGHEPQDSRMNALWLASIIVFMLFILILKLSRKKRDIIRQGSACGKPVEESGEKFLSPV